MAWANLLAHATRPRRLSGTDVFIEAAFQSLLAANGLDALDALFEVEGSHTFAKPGLPGWRERIRLELDSPNGSRRAFYLKRYTAPPVGPQVRRILSGRFGHATAWAEWNSMRVLTDCGINAVQPVAFAQEMTGIWERRSALLTAEVEGESLEKWVVRNPGRAPCKLRDALARFVARFHRQGFVHRDLYLSHIFIDESDPDAPAFRLIDLQRVFRPRWRRARWIVKDLAALNYATPRSVATTTDRLRWLQLYLGVSKLRGCDRALVRRIVLKTRRMGRHDRRMRNCE